MSHVSHYRRIRGLDSRPQYQKIASPPHSTREERKQWGCAALQDLESRYRSERSSPMKITGVEWMSVCVARARAESMSHGQIVGQRRLYVRAEGWTIGRRHMTETP